MRDAAGQLAKRLQFPGMSLARLAGTLLGFKAFSRRIAGLDRIDQRIDFVMALMIRTADTDLPAMSPQALNLVGKLRQRPREGAVDDEEQQDGYDEDLGRFGHHQRGSNASSSGRAHCRNFPIA